MNRNRIAMLMYRGHMTQLLEGKTGLVMGVANKRSIAWGIANAANKAGARLILTYQNERLGENVRDLAPQLTNPLLLPCDVSNDGEITTLMSRIGEEVGHLDFLIHALAYAPREAFDGMYADTKREDFRIALDVSAYSLVAGSRADTRSHPRRCGNLRVLYRHTCRRRLHVGHRREHESGSRDDPLPLRC